MNRQRSGSPEVSFDEHQDPLRTKTAIYQEIRITRRPLLPVMCILTSLEERRQVLMNWNVCRPYPGRLLLEDTTLIDRLVHHFINLHKVKRAEDEIPLLQFSDNA